MSGKKESRPDPAPPPGEEVAETAPDTGAEAPELDAAELLDRLQRLQAEFENYRKRKAREREGWAARAVEALVLDLLPVLDSFDRAIEAARGAEAVEPVLEGMSLVHRQLLGALKKHGVEPIEALGRPFDPNLHEAFMSRPPQGGEEPGTIVQEYQKGYRLGDRTIRATKSVVAAVPEEEAGPEAGPEEE